MEEDLEEFELLFQKKRWAELEALGNRILKKYELDETIKGNIYYLMACSQCQLLWPVESVKMLLKAYQAGWINYKVMDAEPLLEYLRTGSPIANKKYSEKEVQDQYKQVRTKMKKEVDSEDPIFKDERVMELFGKYDKDASGTIDSQEFTQMMKQLQLNEEQIKILLNAIDEDKNGHIDLMEFRYFVNRYHQFFEDEKEEKEAHEVEEEEPDDLDGWSWSEKPTLISESLKVSNRGLSVSRPEQDKIRNPCVFTASTFNNDVNRFRVYIKQIGTWLAIGVADTALATSGGTVLGTQEEVFNSCLYSQMKTSIKTSSQPSISLGEPLAAGDFIDLQLDFNNQIIKYWKNGKLLAPLRVIGKFKMIEDEVAPVVSMSVGTTVIIKNTFPTLNDVVQNGLASLKLSLVKAVEFIRQDTLALFDKNLLRPTTASTPRIGSISEASAKKSGIAATTDEVEKIKKILQDPLTHNKLSTLDSLLSKNKNLYRVTDAEQIVRGLVGGNWETKFNAALLFKGRLIGNPFLMHVNLNATPQQKYTLHAKLGLGIPAEAVKAKNLPMNIEREVTDQEYKFLKDSFSKYAKYDRADWFKMLFEEYPDLYLNYLHLNYLLDLVEPKDRAGIVIFLAQKKRIVAKFQNNLSVFVSKMPDKNKVAVKEAVFANWRKSATSTRSLASAKS